VPHSGVPLGPSVLRLLLYADDLALLASSADHLQQQLNALRAFCTEYDMEVNVSKTEIVAFGKQKYKGAHVWQYAGAPVKVSEQFKYLGIMLDATKGVSAATGPLRAAGQRAMWGLLSRCKALRVHNLGLKVDLFGSLVAPVLCYGADVWGPAHLAKQCDDAMHAVQFDFLRLLAGKVRKSTSRHVLLREFGMYPLSRRWLQAVVGLWNVAAQRVPGDVLRLAMDDNWAMAHGTGASLRGRPVATRRKQVWCAEVAEFLTLIGVPVGSQPGSWPATCLCVEEVLAKYDEWFCAVWSDLPRNPRTAPSDQVVCCTYDRWCVYRSSPAPLPLKKILKIRPQHVQFSAGIHPAHLCSLLRFRLGAHDLRVATGRWQKPRLERQQRVCQWCTQGRVEDEFHMVFECSAYDRLRQRFGCLFDMYWADPLSECVPPPRPRTEEMAVFLAQPDRLVAAFIHECWLHRCSLRSASSS
jgi:hypothetical protein